MGFNRTVVFVAGQNLLDAINIDEKNSLYTINIDEPLDTSLVGITQNTPVEVAQETPVLRRKTDKNIESECKIYPYLGSSASSKSLTEIMVM